MKSAESFYILRNVSRIYRTKQGGRERGSKQFKIVLFSRPSFSTSWSINKKRERERAPFSADVFNLFILFARLKFTFLIHLRVSSRGFVVLFARKPRVARNRSMMRLLFYVKPGTRYDEPADTMKFSRANCGVRIDPAK